MNGRTETYCNQCRTWSPSEEWEGPIEPDPPQDYVVCPNCGHHHPPYDPPIRERANVNDTPTESRWSGFSDEELRAVRDGFAADPTHDQGSTLVLELEAEIERRLEAAPNYRGPGVYRHVNAAELDGVRVIGLAIGSATGEKYVVIEGGVDSEVNPTDYSLMRLERFNRRREDGTRVYEFLEPLPVEDPGERVSFEGVAARIRDWIHETPLSQCYAGADTCEDWDLAYALARLALRHTPKSRDKELLALNDVYLVGDLRRATIGLDDKASTWLERVLINVRTPS